MVYNLSETPFLNQWNSGDPYLCKASCKTLSRITSSHRKTFLKSQPPHRACPIGRRYTNVWATGWSGVADHLEGGSTPLGQSHRQSQGVAPVYYLEPLWCLWGSSFSKTLVLHVPEHSLAVWSVSQYSTVRGIAKMWSYYLDYSTWFCFSGLICSIQRWISFL